MFTTSNINVSADTGSLYPDTLTRVIVNTARRSGQKKRVEGTSISVQRRRVTQSGLVSNTGGRTAALRGSILAPRQSPVVTYDELFGTGRQPQTQLSVGLTCSRPIPLSPTQPMWECRGGHRCLQPTALTMYGRKFDAFTTSFLTRNELCCLHRTPTPHALTVTGVHKI